MLPTQSNEIDKLTTAFVEARKAARPFREDSKANYGSYVSIDEIKSCTNQALLDNGLSLTQMRTFVDGQIFLVTKITHISGQWQAGHVPLIIPENPKNIDQAYGSSMTYQRRYELYGLFAFKGEEEIDQDGEKSTPPDKDHNQSNNDKYANSPLRDWHVKELNDAFDRFENSQKLKDEWLKCFGVTRMEDLKQKQQREIMQELKAQL